MNFFQILGEFLKALPEVLKLVSKLLDEWKEAKRSGAIKDINAALDQSALAKTPGERSRAMANLARAISKPR